MTRPRFTHHPNLEDRIPFLALAGAVLIIALGGVGLLLFQANQTRTVRCYVVKRPLTISESEILAGDFFECTDQLYRLTFKISSSQGRACFFHTQEFIGRSHFPLHGRTSST